MDGHRRVKHCNDLHYILEKLNKSHVLPTGMFHETGRMLDFARMFAAIASSMLGHINDRVMLSAVGRGEDCLRCPFPLLFLNALLQE
jgi:hypothetical protein